MAHFGERCLWTDRKHYHCFNNDLPVDITTKAGLSEFYAECQDSTIKDITIEYLVETHLLAECNSLYATLSGGTMYAYFLNAGKYEHIEFYNEGFYQNVEKL